LENCAGWGARSIMPEIGSDGNVENQPGDDTNDWPVISNRLLAN